MLEHLQSLSQKLTTAKQKCAKLRNEEGELDEELTKRAEDVKEELDQATQQVNKERLLCHADHRVSCVPSVQNLYGFNSIYSFYPHL